MERSSGAAPPRPPGEGDDPAATRTGERLAVSIEPAGSHASVVSLSGELDLSTVPILEKRLLQELRSKEDVVVDLTKLSFIDSSGIGLLIRAFRSCEQPERLHTVIAGGSQIERVFELAGIGRALPLFMNRQEAIAALDGAATD